MRRFVFVFGKMMKLCVGTMKWCWEMGVIVLGSEGIRLGMGGMVW